MGTFSQLYLKIQQNKYVQIFIIYTRYLIGFAFVVPSFVKIKAERFTSFSGESESMGTAFHYFETMYQTGLYWQCIGVGQFIAGALLITQKYSKLGAIIYLPIILNIALLTWSLDFGTGTPVIATLLLSANILLLVWDYGSFKVLLNKPQKVRTYWSAEDDPFWTYLGMLYLAFSCFAGLVDRHKALLLLFPFFILGIASVFWKLYKYRKIA